MKPVKVVCHDKTAGVSLARIHGNTCKIIWKSRSPHSKDRQTTMHEAKSRHGKKGRAIHDIKTNDEPVLLNFKRCSSNAYPSTPSAWKQIVMWNM
jgi:hypothetical protein